MHRFFYKILLYLLRALIYLKRFLFWLLNLVWSVLIKIEEVFRNTIGFRFYKIGYSLKKIFGRAKIPWDSRIVEFLGKRSTLQIVLFIVAVVVMIPHTRLYTIDTNKIAGRETLLYKLVGPGEQDFDIQEISVDVTALARIDNVPTWKEGAVTQQSPSQTTEKKTITQQEISSISVGGTAVTKPIISPSAVLPTAEETALIRSDVIVHVVQPGDTIGAIAEKYEVTQATVLWSNGLTARSYIRPGDELKILPISGLVHKVKKGDTILKIAKNYDTDAEKIIKFNRLKEDGADIVVGEELVIPDGVKPQPVYTYTPTTRKYTSLSKVAAPPKSVNVPAGTNFLWPTSVRYISQYYGWRHTGLDIAGPVGSPLYASKSGRVIKSQCGWNGGYGCYVIVDHGGGVQTVYAHATKLYVKVGESVAQGQTIAAMGSTGRSTGSHIHFEVRVNGRRMNPLKYIR